MATKFSPCKGSYVLNQFPSNVMFGMNGFHVSASGAIQGHHGPLVSKMFSIEDASRHMSNNKLIICKPSLKCMHCPHGSVVRVSDSRHGDCEFDSWLRQTFFLAQTFSAEACEKSSRWLWKESCVNTVVRKPGNTYASPTTMIRS